jgi:hypothetical protein
LYTQDLLCGSCKAKSRRLVRYAGVDVITLNKTHVETNNTDKASAGKKKYGSTGEGAPQDEDKPWKFKCKCGDVCSSYEREIYHPGGQWYECTQCCVWSHVQCNLGSVTPAEILDLKVRHRAFRCVGQHCVAGGMGGSQSRTAAPLTRTIMLKR